MVAKQADRKRRVVDVGVEISLVTVWCVCFVKWISA